MERKFATKVGKIPFSEEEEVAKIRITKENEKKATEREKICR